MNRHLRQAAALGAALTLSAQAQPAALDAAVTRVLSAQTLNAAWFAPQFLTAVPLATVQAQFTALRGQYGAFVRLERGAAGLRAVYERGALRVTAALDAAGRLSTLGLAPEAPAGAAQLLRELFTAPTVDPARFSPTFLAQVPAAQLQALFTSIREQQGALKDVQPQPGGYRLTFERGELDVAAFALDAQGRIESLLLRPVTPTVTLGTLEDARAAVRALPGRAALLVREVGGPDLLAERADEPLAVASAFKLAVLAELQAQVAAGRRAWDARVTLREADKSLPSGTLQNAPAGTAYTLRDLAARMIRDSDNTATDLLLRAVGRTGVEARLGGRVIPSTREAFALKAPGGAALLRDWRAASTDAGRRSVLARAAAAPLPPISAFAGGAPLAPDVEWFVPARTLCTLMAEVAALPETTLNPGVADRADFGRVSYKGGSEGGVLNLTTQVTTKAGKNLCVSATWNDAGALNEGQFFALYGAVLKLLK